MKIILTHKFSICGASLWAYYRAIVVETVDTLDLKFRVYEFKPHQR